MRISAFLFSIEEKLAYLNYLLETPPKKVLTPCGWLRKAIEDDYAAPDEYRASEAQTDEIVAIQDIEEVLQQAFEGR